MKAIFTRFRMSFCKLLFLFFFFFGHELREKTVHLDNCQAQYTRLQQDLEVYKYAYHLGASS